MEELGREGQDIAPSYTFPTLREPTAEEVAAKQELNRLFQSTFQHRNREEQEKYQTAYGKQSAIVQKLKIEDYRNNKKLMKQLVDN